MKTKISAAILVIIVLLGVSANTAAYAQIITPQQPTTNIVKPVQVLNSNPNLNNNIQSASVDLNNPIGLGQNSQSNLLVNCPTGVVVYQPSLINNQIVPICVTAELLNNHLFNVDVNVKDNDDNDDNNKHHKKHYHYYYQDHKKVDPRYDDKYDMIDWQDDDASKNLSIKEMDKILEDQQEKNQNTDDQSVQTKTASLDSDSGENTDESESSDGGLDSSPDSDAGDDGGDSGGDSDSDGGDSGGNSGGDSGSDSSN